MPRMQLCLRSKDREHYVQQNETTWIAPFGSTSTIAKPGKTSSECSKQKGWGSTRSFRVKPFRGICLCAALHSNEASQHRISKLGAACRHQISDVRPGCFACWLHSIRTWRRFACGRGPAECDRRFDRHQVAGLHNDHTASHHMWCTGDPGCLHMGDWKRFSGARPCTVDAGGCS